MDTDNKKSRLRAWLVRLFVRAIKKISREEDRAEVLQWLRQSRDVLSGDGPSRQKFADLYALINARKTAMIVVHGVVESVKNYKDSDLPLSTKLAIPVTLLAAPALVGHGAGVVALGGAIGLPVLLLVFLGTAGITAIIETFVKHEESRPYLYDVLTLIARDEILRRTSAVLRSAMCDDPVESRRFPMPEDEQKLRTKLLTMDPFDFERHVVGFFQGEGMRSWVTKKSNDLGVDGFATHPEGTIVIQCKRYSPENPVGRPAIQQLKGVIEEHGALKGYLVTTSRFSSEARTSAELSEKLVLVDMDELVLWHSRVPQF
ncbi:MAG: restriction endonuclease [Alphaproteobacteria bacterium]